MLDTTSTTVIYDSAWPTIEVKNFDEVLMVDADLAAFDAGGISADEFIEMWGIHPDAEYLVSMPAL